jgi:tetratricopeptide (TPR) repeat protein
MTAKSTEPAKNHTVPRLLPWWVAGGAVLFYWATLNYWISLTSLRTVVRVSDWLWYPDPGRPLAWLVFAPFRLLPDAWVPVVLNLVTALAAALVLGQLARSVAIMRVDVVAADAMRQRVAETAVFTGPLVWLPPVFAALALGLQAGFWEHATSATGEIFSVLCFAFAWRAVLEFRLGREDKWLYRAALVFALGMADNGWMLAYLPVFVGAVIWAKGFSPFLNLRFLARMLGAALLGMSLYLLVPAVLALAPYGAWDFEVALKSYLGAQKGGLLTLRAPVFRLLILTGLLPFVLLAVRWRSHSVQLADDTRHGVFFTKASGHFIHALFLGTALWLTLQPVLSPYQASLTPPLLVYYYPWALVAGYATAYLLVFGLRRGNRPSARWPALTAKLLLAALPILLLVRNWGDLRVTNGGAVREFARQLAADLPAGKPTVLSDDLRYLLLAGAAQTKSEFKQPLLVDTRLLPLADYHERLRRRHPERWPELPPAVSNAVSAPVMLAIMSQVATNGPVVYLHPSSGLFYERFEATPLGWAQELKFRSGVTNGVGSLAAVAAVWEERWTTVLARRAEQLAAARQRQAWWAQPGFRAVKLGGPANETAQFLSGAYAKALNHFGVALALEGDLAGARRWYERAIAFNPDNAAARINLEFAERRHRGESHRLSLEWMQEIFAATRGGVGSWADLVSRHGPVDEPTALLQAGRVYLLANNPQQALERFTRSSELAPDWAAPQLARAQCLNVTGNFAGAEAVTAQIIGSAAIQQLPGVALAQLLQVRAIALRRLGQTNEAAIFIAEFTTAHQAAEEVVTTAIDLFAAAGQGEAVLGWLDRLLQRDPKRVPWLVAKGNAELRQRQYAAALKTLDTALILESGNSDARLFRALAALATGQLDVAGRDFQTLLNNSQHVPGALFGLGGLAWRQQDTNAMVAYYEAFLTNTADSVSIQQTTLATERLKEWRRE